MKVRIAIFLIFGSIFFNGCANKHFKIYKMDGQPYNLKSNVFKTSPTYDFKLFFNREDISNEYNEVAIFATDNFYYGQFFLDDIFMKILKVKTSEINADAIIYEKDRTDFPNYNEKFLYFTAIKYKFVK